MSTEKLNISVNILFSKSGFDRLDKLGEATGRTRSSAARVAIESYAAMLLDNIPTCANGAACYVPHLHIKPPSNEHQTLGPAGTAIPAVTP